MNNAGPPATIADAVSRKIRGRIYEGLARRPEKGRSRLEPAENAVSARPRLGIPPAQQRMEALKQVREPEAGIVDVRLLVLEAEDGDADLVEERGAIDLLLRSRRSPAPPPPPPST